MWGFIFPGQGSQHSGMGKFLFDEFKSVRLIFEEGSETLKIDLKKLLFEASESDLALTHNTQPALLTVSHATDLVLKSEFGITPSLASGHSVGEYGALVSAEVFTYPEALQAVRLRGISMQKAVPVGQGAMAAVMGLTPEQTKVLCQWAEKETQSQPLEPANFNAPGQVVISGKKITLDWMMENFKSELVFKPEDQIKRVKFIPLKVSAPFHCSLMKPAEEEMRTHLESLSFKNPKYPVIQNFKAQIERDTLNIKESLIKQITGAVRWVECVEGFRKQNFKNLVEVGSGKVLSGLVKKIDPELSVFNLGSLDDFKALGKQGGSL